MGIPISFVLVYLLGGLTLLPGVLVLVLLHAYLTFPSHSRSSKSEENYIDPLRDSQDDRQNLKSKTSATGLAEKFHRRHEPDVASGYFAVCREYVPGGINGKPPERTTPAGAVVVLESPSVYQSMYRSLFDRRQGPSLDLGKSSGKTVKRARNVFFVVLRHGHLMLYEDSEQLEVRHVISLELHDVDIYGGEDIIPEGELWIKRNAIRLQRKPAVEDPTSTSKPFFFFSDNCSDKEDFYFALLQNQDVRLEAVDNPPRPQQYEAKHIIDLVQRLHSSEEQLQTRWINGLVGRLFLALYKTRLIEDFVRTKITKKIARVKKPAFLSGLVLHKIDMGDSAPQITNPRLKDLTIDGDCCVEADLKYSGNFRLEIAATARIDLGTRFKAREVDLVLAVVVKKLNGHALVKFKPPPSNRIWLSFEKMPDMDMAIEPIVSSRQITYGIILRAIEGRIREVMAETVVLPHWDDSPFIDTTDQRFRGGIWTEKSSAVDSQPSHTHIPDEAPEDEAEADVEVEAASVLHSSPRIKEERTMSMPLVSNASASIPAADLATNSAKATSDSAMDGISTGSQRRNEPPKAMRSRSFASPANPLLSMDNANVESAQIEQKNKQQQDAASAIKAISSRSRPTSPSDASNTTARDTSTLWENSKYVNGKFSEANSYNPKASRARTVDSPTQISSPPTPTSMSSRSTKSGFGNDLSQSKVSQGDSNSSVNVSTSEKKQSMATLGAATAAAKSWGWGVLNRNSNQKGSQSPNQERAGSPNKPMGRGRPLPPPGQPLPFPETARSKNNLPIPTQRKPVAPPLLPQRKQDEVKARTDAPPPLPSRKRQSSNQPEKVGEEGLLVVKAPPDSEPSSPVDTSEYVENHLEHKPQSVDFGEGGTASVLIGLKAANSERTDSDRVQHSYKDDESALSAWDSAQEEEDRSRGVWPGIEEQS